MRTITTVAAALIAAAALAGCGEKKIAADALSKQVSSKLEETVGQKPDKVDCPDLPGKKGSKVTCTLTAGSDTVDIDVTSKGVEGDKIPYTIKVADSVN